MIWQRETHINPISYHGPSEDRTTSSNPDTAALVRAYFQLRPVSGNINMFRLNVDALARGNAYTPTYEPIHTYTQLPITWIKLPVDLQTFCRKYLKL